METKHENWKKQGRKLTLAVTSILFLVLFSYSTEIDFEFARGSDYLKHKH